MDVMSPSDPFVVYSIRDPRSKQYRNFAKSEVVWDNPNPDFVKQIQLDYMFEEVQQIRCDIYDADSENTSKLSDHDYVGYFEFRVGDLVTAGGQKLSGQLRDKKGNRVIDENKKPCLIEIRAEEVSNNKDEAVIQFSCKGLPKMDWFFGKCDGFLTLYRATEDGGWMATTQTDVVKANYDPVFKPLRVSVQRLCNGDYQRPILIKCHDWNENAEPDYVGEVQTCLADLMSKSALELREKKNGKIGKHSRGQVNLRQCNIRQRFSFLDFITGGCEINLMVAIDFTASNGDPKDHRSLHFTGNQHKENEYQQAIRAVGSVLEPYDSDQKIPAWGFGGKDYNQQVRHCFPLNGNPQDPEVHGIQGILQAYQNSLNNYRLSGPTLFSETIETATTMSLEPQTASSQHYTILLLITDGVLNDVQKTIDTIVAASNHPMSIIIVGVGNADFTTMDVLDADDEPLISSRGQKMQADIVQFVPFNKFKGHHPAALAKEVLEEVPEQLTGYFERIQMKPMPKKALLDRYSSYGSLPDVGSGPAPASFSNMGEGLAHSRFPGSEPMAPPPPSYQSKAQLPPGWEEQVDPKTGNSYFVNHQTQSTQWHRPMQ